MNAIENMRGAIKRLDNAEFSLEELPASDEREAVRHDINEAQNQIANALAFIGVGVDP